MGRRIYYEVVVKVKGRQEVTSTFTDRGNAERVYEIAIHGVVNLTTPLLDLPRAFWKGKRELADRVLSVPGFTAGPACQTCREALGEVPLDQRSWRA